ncbi:hypothetical protein Pmani_038403 [Petrolisthes manimaculis]|uniref:Uncharacterized protein n=1 Tax=Petrolisthes manimaculis TaxID=1843537 RepID=A0AAE1TKF1_9EUCA|nr:hypothetical protein Pmani_038403 [Petrolisthes manimaculis]
MTQASGNTASEEEEVAGSDVGVLGKQAKTPGHTHNYGGGYNMQ